MNDVWEVNDMGFVSSGLCIVALHCSIDLHCLFGRCMFFGLAWLDTCTSRKDDIANNGTVLSNMHINPCLAHNRGSRYEVMMLLRVDDLTDPEDVTTCGPPPYLV